MTVEALAARFPSAKPTRDGWSIKCPVHDDRVASVSLSAGTDGRVLLYCHAGCRTPDLLAAVGLTVADLFDDAPIAPPPATPVLTAARAPTTYDYRDLDGELLHQVVRGADKSFRQRQPDGDGWVWKASDQRVPYRWPDLVGHPTVWIVEGEKDVDACWAHDVAATCNRGGAGKWGNEETAALVRAGVRAVCVVPDQDVPGRRHAQAVVEQCRAAALTATLVSLPGLPTHGDISDWWAAGGTTDALTALGQAAAAHPADRPDVALDAPEATVPELLQADQTFTRLGEGRYQLAYPQLGIVLEASEVHRDRSQELHGELTVTTTLAGAKTIDGVLLWTSMNFSSQRTRATTASSLAGRSGAASLDWVGAVETLALRVARAEAEGTPIQALASYPRPAPTETWEVLGLPLLRQHPMILFGDGGSAKSYLALHLAATLAGRGVRVLFADWEFSPEDHRERLERLTGEAMPHDTLHYVRCAAPLVSEAQRLQRHIIEHGIEYIVCDSIAFAVPGRPEDAEHAAAYFRAVRYLGVGSLHLAHTTKSLDHGTDKPFGSVFWSNGARSVWFAKRAGEQGDAGDVVEVALSHKKSNTGRRLPTVGVRLRFAAERTRVESFDVADSPELAAGLAIWQRMRALVKTRPLTVPELAEELGEKPQSIKRAIQRGDIFVRGDDNKVRLTTALEGPRPRGTI